MEYIPIIISLFFIIGWTVGVLTVKTFQILPNIYTVIWWWISFALLYLGDQSFWHLFWIMPLIAIASVFGVISSGPLLGFFIGGLPIIFYLFFIGMF